MQAINLLRHAVPPPVCPLGSVILPGFDPEDMDVYLWGTAEDGCVPTCVARYEEHPIAGLPFWGCDSYIDTLICAAPGFACICEHGVGAPECEGTGGSGATGGAGGGPGGGGGSMGGAGGS